MAGITLTFDDDENFNEQDILRAFQEMVTPQVEEALSNALGEDFSATSTGSLFQCPNMPSETIGEYRVTTNIFL